MKDNFGFNQISSTTPSWAKWFFRIVFLFTKIVVGYIAATNLISPEAKYEITLFLTLVIDPLAFAFSKMFGVNSKEDIQDLFTDPPPPIVNKVGLPKPKKQ